LAVWAATESDYHLARAHEWKQLVGERERAPTLYNGQQLKARLDEIAEKLATIDAEDVVRAQRHHERQRLRNRAYELAAARVLDFVGAPGAQMAAAARLWGHCFNCGKELTDPISLERGIGPDCLVHKVTYIKSWLGNAAVEVIANRCGMPVEFVAEIARTAQPAKTRHSTAPTSQHDEGPHHD
jgi:hypothetical protein